MNENNPQALNEEIQQSAKKILKHLNEFEFGDDSQMAKKESDFITLLSSLQTDESADLLSDVNKWTENRVDSYQRFEKPLLNQVETNQKIFSDHVANDAIPAMKNQMDEFDLKLINAKSKLSTLSENVIKTASEIIDKDKSKSQFENQNPQFELNLNQHSIDSNEDELLKIEYENEVIKQLRKREDYFVNALKNFDKEIGAIKTDLDNSKEDYFNLANENAKLKRKIELLENRNKLEIGNEINMEICSSNLFFDIEKNDIFDFFHEGEKNENKIESNLEFFQCETFDINSMEDDYVVMKKSDADEYFNYVKNKSEANSQNQSQGEVNDQSQSEVSNQNENQNEVNNQDQSEVKSGRKYQYTTHHKQFGTDSITSEISYKMKVNEKGEIVFDLRDEIGNSVFGSFSPESSEEMQKEIQKDIEHLISMNASSELENSNRASQNDTSSSPSFGVSVNRRSDFTKGTSLGTTSNRRENEGNFTFAKNPYEGPQPILPIGIRPKEGQNGDIGFRLFFKQNNDALVLDANVRQRTRDGLIVLNNPSPNILIRIENGFSSEFISRCRENPNLNFILRPYHPDGSKEKVVGLCENEDDNYRSNFFRNTPCLWNSFSVRPPPMIYRSNNRPQTCHFSAGRQNNHRNLSSSLESPPPSPASMREMPNLSPQQVYQMRRSSPSSIMLRKTSEVQEQRKIVNNSQLPRVRRSYNQGKIPMNDEHSPRKLSQMKNGRRIVSPDNKSRCLRLNDPKTKS